LKMPSLSTFELKSKFSCDMSFGVCIQNSIITPVTS
jgi:hypothetical protein